MSTRARARRTLRRHLARASAAVPAARGPEPWQTLVARAQLAEARRRLRGDRAPDAARRLVEPWLSDPAEGTRAWTVLAEIRESEGDLAGALVAARTAVATDPPLEARVLHQRLAARAGLRDEARSALDRLLECRPRNRRELTGVLLALRQAGADDVARYLGSLREWGILGHDELLTAVAAEIAVADAAPADLDDRLTDATRRLEHPLPVIARALDRRGAWSRLAAYADTAGGSERTVSRRREAALELRRAAARALSAGHAGTAKRLAAHALARHPDDPYAQTTWVHATDQLRIAREGWPAPATVVASRFEPRPRAVLSVLAQSLPHQSGGYATRSHGILTGLAAAGWEVEAVTRLGFPYDRWPKADPREVPAHDDIDGVRYHRILEVGRREYPQHPLESYVDRYARALAAHARRHRPALLHAASFHVNGLATRAAAARLGLPYVYEMRGLEDLMKVSRDPRFADSDRRAFLDRVELASCLGAERVFVITDALRREMAARGVPEERLVVLPNGVRADRFAPRARDPELEERLGLRGHTVIGYAGGLVDYEGLELLLEAVAAVTARRGDVRLVVVGDGPHESAVHAAAERLRLGGVVTFTGRVPHDEVQRYLSLFDITPFPRLPLPVCELISPIKPFESMAMGKAVVVSSVAALAEIVTDGTTGRVFQKGSAVDLARVLEQLVDEPDQRAKLGESARTWVRNERDWSAIVEVVTAAYDEIVG